MRIIISFLFLMLSQSLAVKGQFDIRKIDAKLKVDNHSGLLTVKGVVENFNNVSVPITYRLKVLKLEQGNQSNSVQANVQEVDANKLVELSSVSINHSPNDEVYISFLVKHGNSIIKEIEKTIPEGIDKEKFRLSKNKAKRQGNVPSQADLLKKHIEAFQARKQQQKDSLKENEYRSYYGEMLNGVVIDETFTRMGKEFYDYFYSTYQIANREASTLLTIKEVFLQNRSIQRSKVIIRDDDVIIFQAILQPRPVYLEAVAEQANQVVNQYLKMVKQNLNK